MLEYLERHEDALIILIQSTEHVSHVYVCRQISHLQGVHHPQEVPPLIQIGTRQHPNQQSEIRLPGDRISEIRDSIGGAGT